MTYQPTPITKRGDIDRATTSDKKTQELLAEILAQLKIHTLHLAKISNTNFTDEDIDT